MASKSICFLSFIIFFCIHFGSIVQGNGLQQAEKGIYGSVKNTSKLHANASTLYANASTVYANASTLYVNASTDIKRLWAPTFLGDHEEAFAMLRTHRGRYFHAKATMSVHGVYHNIDISQLTVAAVWVMNLEDGSPQKLNSISAGWHVVPGLYGHKGTRFFVSWLVVDGDSTRGCINFQCKGFVLHKGSTYIPGALIEPLSIYNGEQWYITIKITQDPETGNWWVYHGPNGDKPIGYWPTSLFTSLLDSATNVNIGGSVVFDSYDLEGPPMGSGHFPLEGEGRAASLTNLEINNMPADDDTFYTIQSMPNLYQIGGDVQKMYFGGPGGFDNSG